MKKKQRNVKKSRQCYQLQNDMTREILYSNLKLSKNISLQEFVEKINKIKIMLKLTKIKAIKENINDFIKTLYANNGFSHLMISNRRKLRYFKYKNNVDLNCISDIIEKDTMRIMSTRNIVEKYKEKYPNAKISISKMWNHIYQLGYNYSKLNTINKKY